MELERQLKMVELKLITWDKYEAVFSWMGLHIVGRQYDSDTFKWSFPELDLQKAMTKKIDTGYIISRHEIPRFGETLQKHLEGECKKELEKLLEKELQDDLNQQVLIEMLFDGIVIIGDK
jgi:hypothetical protein